MLRWLALRFVVPIIVGGTLVAATRGRPFFDIFGSLVWTLLGVHLLCTFSLRNRHALDTGSFFFLIFACGAVANANERGNLSQPRTWLIPALMYIAYSVVSFIGTKRAQSAASRKSSGFVHVLAGGKETGSGLVSGKIPRS
jgi:hypothetical protein